MKKILLAIACLWAACISCSEDTKIGAPDEILPDYVLPQGDASKEANDRIQQIFDTYTSYVLYNYTEKDALWTQTVASKSIGLSWENLAMWTPCLIIFRLFGFSFSRKNF